MKKASETQIGGNHYSKYPIQPGYYAYVNKLMPMEFNAVKYITRHRDKGLAEDIHKAINCLTLLLEWEYPEDPHTWVRTEIPR